MAGRKRIRARDSACAPGDRDPRICFGLWVAYLVVSAGHPLSDAVSDASVRWTKLSDCWIFHSVSLYLFVVNNPTAGIYYWFCVGLLFAMYRLESKALARPQGKALPRKSGLVHPCVDLVLTPVSSKQIRTGWLVRILHVVPSYLPATRYGGPIYSVHGLAKALAELGHEVEVFTTNIDGPGVSDVPTTHPVAMDGVQVHYFSASWLRRLFYAPSMKPALDRLARTFDVMHLHSVFLWPTWAAARAAVKHEIPYVISPRGMLVKELIRRRNCFVKGAWIELIERRNIERAAAIHLTSDLETYDIEKFDFRLPKVFVVPNGIDLPERPAGRCVSEDIDGAIVARSICPCFRQDQLEEEFNRVGKGGCEYVQWPADHCWNPRAVPRERTSARGCCFGRY